MAQKSLSDFTDRPKRDGSKVKQTFVIFTDCYPRPLYSHACFLVGFFLFFFYCFIVFLLFCWSFSHVGQNRKKQGPYAEITWS